jgi:hypothetical protein
MVARIAPPVPTSAVIKPLTLPPAMNVPVSTKTNSQMEGIRSDIQAYNDAVQYYNEFAEFW